MADSNTVVQAVTADNEQILGSVVVVNSTEPESKNVLEDIAANVEGVLGSIVAGAKDCVEKVTDEIEHLRTESSPVDDGEDMGDIEQVDVEVDRQSPDLDYVPAQEAKQLILENVSAIDVDVQDTKSSPIDTEPPADLCDTKEESCPVIVQCVTASGEKIVGGVSVFSPKAEAAEEKTVLEDIAANVEGVLGSIMGGAKQCADTLAEEFDQMRTESSPVDDGAHMEKAQHADLEVDRHSPDLDYVPAQEAKQLILENLSNIDSAVQDSNSSPIDESAPVQLGDVTVANKELKGGLAKAMGTRAVVGKAVLEKPNEEVNEKTEEQVKGTTEEEKTAEADQVEDKSADANVEVVVTTEEPKQSEDGHEQCVVVGGVQASGSTIISGISVACPPSAEDQIVTVTEEVITRLIDENDAVIGDSTTTVTTSKEVTVDGDDTLVTMVAVTETHTVEEVEVEPEHGMLEDVKEKALDAKVAMTAGLAGAAAAVGGMFAAAGKHSKDGDQGEADQEEGVQEEADQNEDDHTGIVFVDTVKEKVSVAHHVIGDAVHGLASNIEGMFEKTEIEPTTDVQEGEPTTPVNEVPTSDVKAEEPSKDGFMSSLSHAMSDANEKIAEGLHAASDKVNQLIHPDADDKPVESAEAQAESALEGLADDVNEAASEAKDTVTDTVDKVGDMFTSEDQVVPKSPTEVAAIPFRDEPQEDEPHKASDSMHHVVEVDKQYDDHVDQSLDDVKGAQDFASDVKEHAAEAASVAGSALSDAKESLVGAVGAMFAPEEPKEFSPEATPDDEQIVLATTVDLASEPHPPAPEACHLKCDEMDESELVTEHGPKDELKDGTFVPADASMQTQKSESLLDRATDLLDETAETAGAALGAAFGVKDDPKEVGSEAGPEEEPIKFGPENEHDQIVEATASDVGSAVRNNEPAPEAFALKCDEMDDSELVTEHGPKDELKDGTFIPADASKQTKKSESLLDKAKGMLDETALAAGAALGGVFGKDEEPEEFGPEKNTDEVVEATGSDDGGMAPHPPAPEACHLNCDEMDESELVTEHGPKDELKDGTFVPADASMQTKKSDSLLEKAKGMLDEPALAAGVAVAAGGAAIGGMFGSDAESKEFGPENHRDEDTVVVATASDVGSSPPREPAPDAWDLKCDEMDSSELVTEHGPKDILIEGKFMPATTSKQADESSFLEKAKVMLDDTKTAADEALGKVFGPKENDEADQVVQASVSELACESEAQPPAPEACHLKCDEIDGCELVTEHGPKDELKDGTFIPADASQQTLKSESFLDKAKDFLDESKVAVGGAVVAGGAAIGALLAKDDPKEPEMQESTVTEVETSTISVGDPFAAFKEPELKDDIFKPPKLSSMFGENQSEDLPEFKPVIVPEEEEPAGDSWKDAFIEGATTVKDSVVEAVADATEAVKDTAETVKEKVDEVMKPKEKSEEEEEEVEEESQLDSYNKPHGFILHKPEPTSESGEFFSQTIKPQDSVDIVQVPSKEESFENVDLPVVQQIFATEAAEQVKDEAEKTVENVYDMVPDAPADAMTQEQFDSAKETALTSTPSEDLADGEPEKKGIMGFISKIDEKVTHVAEVIKEKVRSGSSSEEGKKESQVEAVQVQSPKKLADQSPTPNNTPDREDSKLNLAEVENVVLKLEPTSAVAKLDDAESKVETENKPGSFPPADSTMYTSSAAPPKAAPRAPKRHSKGNVAAVNVTPVTPLVEPPAAPSPPMQHIDDGAQDIRTSTWPRPAQPLNLIDSGGPGNSASLPREGLERARPSFTDRVRNMCTIL